MALKRTIALVDDDRNILASVSMALEAEGFAVRTYSDGDEAWRGLTAQPADLAILDIKMPRVDGMELLARLRKTSSIRPCKLAFAPSRRAMKRSTKIWPWRGISSEGCRPCWPRARTGTCSARQRRS